MSLSQVRFRLMIGVWSLNSLSLRFLSSWHGQHSNCKFVKSLSPPMKSAKTWSMDNSVCSNATLQQLHSWPSRSISSLLSFALTALLLNEPSRSLRINFFRLFERWRRYLVSK